MKRSPNNYLTKPTQPLRNNIYNMRYTPIRKIQQQASGMCWFYAIMYFLLNSPEIQENIKLQIIRHIQTMTKDELREFKIPINECPLKNVSKMKLLRYFYQIIHYQIPKSRNIELSVSKNYGIRKNLAKSPVSKRNQVYSEIDYMLSKLDLTYPNKNHLRGYYRDNETVKTKLTETIICGYEFYEERFILEGYESNSLIIIIDFEEGDSHLVAGIGNYIFDSNFINPIRVSDFSPDTICSTLQNYYKTDDIKEAHIIAESFIKK